MSALPLEAAYEAEVARQGTAALERIATGGEAGYLPGSVRGVEAGIDAVSLLALCRMGLCRREIEAPPDAPEINGVKARQWRYHLTDRGRAMLAGTATPEPEPLIDAEATTPAMLERRAALAAREV